ncbi:phage tail family protein [Virgibacillus dakarensis]|nr:phage tail family protein [Virgibacillus dakarensis]MBT2215902.1 phage tail family protein [Virgibacillus dakarensis]
MHKSLIFNGVKKPWLYLLEGRKKSPFAPIKNNLLTVPGMAGAHINGTETGVLYITQPVGFIVNDDEHASQLIDELASWLITDESVPLELEDEPGRTYYAKLEGDIGDFEKFVDQRKGTITFLCADPYSYGPEKTHEFTSDIDIITNEGTAEADPIFELEVKKSVTFAMVQNDNEEYQLIGIPTDVEEEVIDTKALLLEERGQSLDTWSDTPTAVDGSVSGTLGTDNDGITVPSYGTDTNDWHGPALIKDIPAIQDFEIEMMAQGRTTNTAQTFRVEFYLFDEGMNVLGKMAIMDNSRNIYRKKAEGRVGPFVGKYQNYLIDSRNYSYDGWDFYYGMLRMRRVGNQFEFYVTRINNNNKHVYSLKETFTDNDNQYMGKLKYVQIHIGKYGDTPRAYAPKINHIKVFELNQATVDQTPYIAYPGDIITFDHKDDEILINGEDRKDLKDFGGSFFKLQKGDNQLIAQPSDSFNTKSRYRPRYR